MEDLLRVLLFITLAIMSMLLSEIFQSLGTLKCLNNVSDFNNWLHKTHNIQATDKIFSGYKFMVECCLNTFISELGDDKLLQIENDFMLNVALYNVVPLEQIDSSCEKTILLKNLKPYIKNILKATTFEELELHITTFRNDIANKFDLIWLKQISTKGKLKKSDALWLLLIDYLHTYLIQINNNGPTANMLNPIRNKWVGQERLDYAFEGYKYATQYFASEILGNELYAKSSLVNIHMADSWRNYTYEQTEDDSEFSFLNRTYKVEKQTSFDSYFDRITNEITDPLANIYNFSIYSTDSQLNFKEKGYDKTSVFGNMLISNTAEETHINLTWEEKIQNKLYWYPFKIFERGEFGSHGIASFNTLLAGNVALHNEESEFDKIIVARFRHPRTIDKSENDYTYGILVDSKSAAGHYMSGWVIYFNECGDYSGFSGMEHKRAEDLIAKYEAEGKVEIRHLDVPLAEFEQFVKQHNYKEPQITVEKENKLVEDIIQKSRASLFELFVYSLFSTNSFYAENYCIELNRNTDAGEIDVLLAHNDKQSLIIVECKLDLDNQNVDLVLNKLDKKAKQFDVSNIEYQLWCWFKPSLKTLDSFRSKGITPIIVSEDKVNPLLKNRRLSHLEFIMQNYKTYANTEPLEPVFSDSQG